MKYNTRAYVPVVLDVKSISINCAEVEVALVQYSDTHIRYTEIKVYFIAILLLLLYAYVILSSKCISYGRTFLHLYDKK